MKSKDVAWLGDSNISLGPLMVHSDCLGITLALDDLLFYVQFVFLRSFQLVNYASINRIRLGTYEKLVRYQVLASQFSCF